jgi:hypothetical protein
MRDDPMYVPPRLDGTEVARFTAWGAAWEEILHAAEGDAKESDGD